MGRGNRRGARRRGTPSRTAGVAERLRAGTETPAETELHVCPRCGSGLVQPTEWAPVDIGRWRVELRCPECRWCGGGVYPQRVLDRFDETLDDGVAELAAELERFQRSNMEEDASRFLDALAAGAILPEDF